MTKYFSIRITETEDVVDTKLTLAEAEQKLEEWERMIK